MFARGYLNLFRIRGVPIRAHWSLPLGVLFFSRFTFAPGLWLSIVFLILSHELGHAFFVRRAGLQNLGIDITGFGGACRWAGHPTPTQRAVIAWGGVVAQFLILAVTWPLVLIFGSPTTVFVADLVHGLTEVNVYLMVLNLIPFRPLDGADAWPLFGHWYKAFKKRGAQKRRAKKVVDAPPQTLRDAMREAERRKLN